MDELKKLLENVSDTYDDLLAAFCVQLSMMMRISGK